MLHRKNRVAPTLKSAVARHRDDALSWGMTSFYRPPLDGAEEDPFARDGDDRLIRRAYWLGLSDRSLTLLMTQGIGTRLTADQKRAHLTDIGRAHLIDAILAPEILPPQR